MVVSCVSSDFHYTFGESFPWGKGQPHNPQ